MPNPVQPFELLLFTMAAVTVLSPPAGAVAQQGLALAAAAWSVSWAHRQKPCSPPA